MQRIIRPNPEFTTEISGHHFVLGIAHNGPQKTSGTGRQYVPSDKPLPLFESDPMFGQLGFFNKFTGKNYEDKLPRDRYVSELTSPPSPGHAT